MEQVVQTAQEILTSNDVLKVTALLYFKEALAKQEFETCADLADAAAKFGASKTEITQVITSYLQGNPQKTQGQGTQGKNRLSSLKETK